ncbi:MAG: alanine racemase [Chloroflexi bacterium]|nr:alanine racemase [Chloroflexota bacterium]
MQRTSELATPRNNALTEGDLDIQSFRPSRVDIDIEALASNVRLIKARVGADTGIMAVVKANAYGHGAVTVSRAALRNGADCLAVANMAEAVQLRRAGIVAPILLLSYLPVDAVAVALQYDITVSLFDQQQAARFDFVARGAGGMLKTHIKVDSGMGRLGILPHDAAALATHLRSCEAIQVDGIYTHFSVADEDPHYTAQQRATFEYAVATMREAGCAFRYVHTANSAATVNPAAGGFNLVRPGLLIYGLKPCESATSLEGLQPVMSWKTVIAQVKTLPPNSPVGYGNSYRTRGEEKIAVLPVGYADGLRRSPRSWREVLVHGRRAPLVGRVSMEKTTIDVSHIPDAIAGDEVVLLGKQGDDEISADEVAAWIDSINYEVLSTILPRVPRI